MNNDLYKIVETLCKWIIIPSIYVCVFCLSIIFLSSFIYNVIAFMGFKVEIAQIAFAVFIMMFVLCFISFLIWLDS